MMELAQALRRVGWRGVHVKPNLSLEKCGDNPDWLRITGPDPQSLLIDGFRAVQLTPGHYLVEFSIVPESDNLIGPKIYLDYGTGYSEDKQSAFCLARIEPHRWSGIVIVRKRARRVRFDPSDLPAGKFAIRHMSIRRLKAQAMEVAKPKINREIFCAAPFIQSLVTTSGQVKPCSVFLASNPQSATSLTEPIWNSCEMRAVRRQMVQGVRPQQCLSCQTREADGVRSVRQVINRAWEDFRWGNPRAEVLEDLAAQTSSDFSLARGPIWLELNLGNLCNLRCRMCSAASSSRIASDPVQVRWTDSEINPSKRESDWSGRWFQDAGFFTDAIGTDLTALTKLELKGGEPFLIKAVAPLLQRLIDIGKSSSIELVIVTSGASAPKRFLELLKQFSQVSLIVSLDGIGALNDYIRDGSHWEEVAQNIALFNNMKNVVVTAAVTVQAYNMLRIAEIAKFAADRELAFSCNMLRHPDYLSCFAMPSLIRIEAAVRIRRYLSGLTSTDIKLTSIKEALSYTATCLESEASIEDGGVLKNFRDYTSDLDLARNQKLSTVNPELAEALSLSGTVSHSRTASGPTL